MSYQALKWYSGAPWQTRPTVLLLGGSGGAGTNRIQLAKAMGTTTSAINFDYCKDIGADRTIDYRTHNWWHADVVYDCVGQAGTGDRAMTKLRAGG